MSWRVSASSMAAADAGEAGRELGGAGDGLQDVGGPPGGPCCKGDGEGLEAEPAGLLADGVQAGGLVPGGAGAELGGQQAGDRLGRRRGGHWRRIPDRLGSVGPMPMAA